MHGLTVLDAFRSVVLIALIWKAISHLKGEENPRYILELSYTPIALKGMLLCPLAVQCEG